MAVVLIFYGLLALLNVKSGEKDGIPPWVCVLGTILLGPMMLVAIQWYGKKRQKRLERRRLAGDDYTWKDELAEKIEDWQNSVFVLLYIAVIARAVMLLFADFQILTALIPVLKIVTAVTTLLFFVVECFLLTPLGLLIVLVVGAVLLFAGSYLVALMVVLFLGSVAMLVLGVLLAMAVAPIVFVVVSGTVVGTLLVPIVTAPLTMAVGAAAATGVTGVAGVYAVNAGVQKISTNQLIRPRNLLINVAMLLALVWPAMTWLDACPGVFAMKPAYRARQQYTSLSEKNANIHYEAFFTGNGMNFVNNESYFRFGEGFYSSYVYTGNNIFAQNDHPSASSGNNLAVYLNGLIYLIDAEKNTNYHTTAYSLKPEDAMVMVGHEVFVFSRNEILLIGPRGRCLWKDTQWTSDFEQLSQEEQYDKLYSILEKQNTSVSCTIDIEDVAMVAYAQRNGILLYYDDETHSAYFAQEGKRGQITILRQSAPGSRVEAASFTPDCDSENLPYTMISPSVVAYIDGNQVIFQGVGEDWKSVHYTNQTANPIVSFHVLQDAQGNVYYAYQDSKDRMYAEMENHSVKEITWDDVVYGAVYTVGSYVVSVTYDSNNPINRLTYINDLTDGAYTTTVWTENWISNRTRLTPEMWGIQQEEETIPWDELSFDERYPMPELRTSVRQVGLYKDNVLPAQYVTYYGPVGNFRFQFPKILYENVEYTWSENETEVSIRFYCDEDSSSLTVTLRPNAEGADHQTLMEELLQQSMGTMSGAKLVRSGLDNEEGSASSFYLKGYAAENGDLICTRLCRVDSAYIMEMELRVPQATGDEDRAYKDYYIMAMEANCGFGSGDEIPSFAEFKRKYGL